MGVALVFMMYILLVVLGLVATCKATMYTVGDSSGWDISTDLNMWQDDKRFVVGDVLSFQYSSSDTVNEVIKDIYDVCNTTNFIQSYSTGNTSITLTQPGDRYFVSGNKLFCLGGMKLQAHVKLNQTSSLVGPGANSPSPNGQTPTSTVPNSAMVRGDRPVKAFVFAIASFVCVTFLLG